MTIIPKQNLRFSQLSVLTGLKRHSINARAKQAFEQTELERTGGNQILLTPEQSKTLIADCINEIAGKVIYIGNLKGGVGKTTIAYLLTNLLTSIGFKCCAIDLDVQANLTSQYIVPDVEQPVFFDVIDNKLDINNVTININENLSFIPSSLRNSLIQKSLSMQSPKHHLSWFNELCLNELRANYDIIIVDTPPHLTTLNSVFCLCLNDSDNIIIPACADDFSIMGVNMFMEDIMDIRRSYNVASHPNMSIVINKFFQNQKTNLEMLVKISQSYPGMVSEVIIKESAKIREIVNHKIPLSSVKQGKEVFEIMSGLLKDLGIIKKD